ncbi:MAG: hypothetical protein IKU77_01215 [Alistipes sp.]|nr:hypothetical protein [Alistipes sp.]
MNGLELEKTYFEEHAMEMLTAANMTKAQFARAMDILPQNINKLISTKNVLMLIKVSTVLDIPIQVLIYGEQEDEPQTDLHGCIYINNVPHIFNNREELDELLKQE